MGKMRGKELSGEKGLWISMLFCFAVMVWGVPFYQIELPLTAGSFQGFYQEALSTKTLLFCIPIVAVLPTGAAYVRESGTGFLKLYLARISRLKYVKRKTLYLYAGGFLPLFFAGSLVWLLCFLCFYPLELVGGISLEAIGEGFFLLLRISLVGGIVAELGGIFGVVFRNYYMAYGLPFICYDMLVILKERYFPDMYAMYPGEWMDCTQDWGMDKSGIWMFFFSFSVSAMLLHGLLLYKKIQEI